MFKISASYLIYHFLQEPEIACDEKKLRYPKSVIICHYKGWENGWVCAAPTWCIWIKIALFWCQIPGFVGVVGGLKVSFGEAIHRLAPPYSNQRQEVVWACRLSKKVWGPWIERHSAPQQSCLRGPHSLCIHSQMSLCMRLSLQSLLHSYAAVARISSSHNTLANACK